MLSKGYTQSDIAKKVGVSYGTVSKKISRIRKTYKEKSEF
ncbi:MAG: sigma-70 family RNA polymerase sigma factor [Ruminococcaceae bacterium]|nr:sigma-70 family RNA polymerase sigma factor [Oscillospiraceae bacterium]